MSVLCYISLRHGLLVDLELDDEGIIHIRLGTDLDPAQRPEVAALFPAEAFTLASELLILARHRLEEP